MFEFMKLHPILPVTVGVLMLGMVAAYFLKLANRPLTLHRVALAVMVRAHRASNIVLAFAHAVDAGLAFYQKQRALPALRTKAPTVQPREAVRTFQSETKRMVG